MPTSVVMVTVTCFLCHCVCLPKVGLVFLLPGWAYCVTMFSQTTTDSQKVINVVLRVHVRVVEKVLSYGLFEMFTFDRTIKVGICYKNLLEYRWR